MPISYAGPPVLDCRRIFAPRSNLASGKGQWPPLRGGMCPQYPLTNLPIDRGGGGACSHALPTGRGRVRRTLTQQTCLPRLTCVGKTCLLPSSEAEVHLRRRIIRSHRSGLDIPQSGACLQHAMADHGAGENQGLVGIGSLHFTANYRRCDGHDNLCAATTMRRKIALVSSSAPLR